jgi:hypothetical protein
MDSAAWRFAQLDHDVNKRHARQQPEPRSLTRSGVVLNGYLHVLRVDSGRIGTHHQLVVFSVRLDGRLKLDLLATPAEAQKWFAALSARASV